MSKNSFRHTHRKKKNRKSTSWKPFASPNLIPFLCSCLRGSWESWIQIFFHLLCNINLLPSVAIIASWCLRWNSNFDISYTDIFNGSEKFPYQCVGHFSSQTLGETFYNAQRYNSCQLSRKSKWLVQENLNINSVMLNPCTGCPALY